jgi:hypothetical protein
MWYTNTNIIRGIALVFMVSMTTFSQQLAQKITSLGLTGPAIVLLETNKSLAFLGSQLLLVAQPTLDIFFAPQLTRQTIDLFADPAQVEQLIVALQTQPVKETAP